MSVVEQPHSVLGLWLSGSAAKPNPAAPSKSQASGEFRFFDALELLAELLAAFFC